MPLDIVCRRCRGVEWVKVFRHRVSRLGADKRFEGRVLPN